MIGRGKRCVPCGSASASKAVVFFNNELAEEFGDRCKQAGQLASKMRFVAAPWVGMLEDGAWSRHAENANRRARQLAAGLRATEEIELMSPVEANAVFARLPKRVREGLSERGWHFSMFIGYGGARFVCSWDTMEQDVDVLLADVGVCLADPALTQEG